MPPLTLEDFTEPTSPPPAPISQDQDEELRLAAYEEGYGAGWEDAITTQSDAVAKREAETSQHLQMLSFGYHEARQHVLRALEPLLKDICGQILPVMARPALLPLVVETLMPLAERAADAPVSLRIAPGARETIERLLPSMTQGFPVTLVEDPILTDGQVMIVSGNTEARVDLDSAAIAIGQAVADFFEIQHMGRANAG